MTTAATPIKEVRIGDYSLSGKIGQGGIAEIFRGRQESLNRDVAIKILHTRLTNDPDIVRRFERESIVVARLNHPNIVHIIDKGCAAGRYYFVMEFVDGTSLREVIDSDRIGLRTKVDIIVQVCKGLYYAHQNGVIHRDIKPANILIDRQGHALIADFGIAQIVGASETEMTATDVVMGTLAYMSPEQKISSTNVDQSTDIYAVGVMLYEILVGKKPLGRFKLPSEIKPELGQAFDPIVSKCLAQDAADRFQSAVELKDRLLEAMGGTEESPADSFAMGGSDSFLGKCRYLDTIKETRFGSTILVENKLNKKLYVIKKHNKGEAGRKEAKLLKTLKHEHIVTIYGAGGDSKSTITICEYAQGGSLADRMVRKWPWEKAFSVILDIASGLDFAHKNNIVHGNIRPSNILVDGNEVFKLTDFGMPVHYTGPRKRNWYSAPERKASRQADIYALGVVLHQMLTGRNPAYDSGSNLRLDDFKNILPEEILNMLRRMLAFRVVHRYKSCEELLLDWDDFDQRRQDRMPPRVVKDQPRPEAKSIPMWVYVAAGTGILVLVTAITYFSGLLN
ncbi:MAG: protein kinase [bacterium]